MWKLYIWFGSFPLFLDVFSVEDGGMEPHFVV